MARRIGDESLGLRTKCDRCGASDCRVLSLRALIAKHGDSIGDPEAPGYNIRLALQNAELGCAIGASYSRVVVVEKEGRHPADPGALRRETRARDRRRYSTVSPTRPARPLTRGSAVTNRRLTSSRF